MGLLQDRELRLIGTAMYMEKDYIKAIELVEQRKVRLEPLITTRFAFKEYLSAYRLIEEKKDKVMKVIIRVNE